MEIEFNATKRDAQGTGASRRLRRTERIPGILYGGGATPQPISMDHNELWHKLKHESFHASILGMVLDGTKQSVLLRDVQMHAYKRQIMHLDFQRVDANQKIHVKVPLHFINADIALGVKVSGGIASHTMNELDVECLPSKLPEFIEVDYKDLQVGQSIHVLDIKLPEGVSAVIHRGENPVVASIIAHKGTSAEDLPTGEEAVAAPAAPAAPAKQTEKK
jgi:large subunit ribosomal protein L25